MLAYTETMPCRKIIKDGELYLARYFAGIDENGSQHWLHNILLPDSDQRLHTHPWDAWGTVLNGGYFEQTRYEQVERYSGFKFRIHQTSQHRITCVKEYTWTHLIVHPGRTDWAFLNEDGTKEIMHSAGEDWWQGCLTRDGKKPTFVFEK